MAYRKGVAVQFGMVTMIANITKATKDDDEAALKQVCCGPAGAEHAPTQVNMKRVCKTCAETNKDDGEIPYSQIKKAQIVGDQFKVIDAQQIADARADTLGATKKLYALTPHPVEGVNGKILPGGSVYYLEPSDAAQVKAYALMHDLVTRHPEVVLLGLWTPASRANLYRLTTYGDALIMEQQYRTEQLAVVEPMIAPVDAAVQAQLDAVLPMVLQPFDPATYVDRYAEALANTLSAVEAVDGVVSEKAKSSGTPVVPTGAGVDLMAQLAAMAGAAAPAKPTTRKKATA